MLISEAICSERCGIETVRYSPAGWSSFLLTAYAIESYFKFYLVLLYCYGHNLLTKMKAMHFSTNRNQLKLVLFLPFFLLLSQVSLAQESIHSAGVDGSASTGSVSISIGQLVYNEYSSVTGTEGQGVQQPYDLVKVKSVDPLALVQTNWGKDPILPTKVNILLTEGQTLQVEVTWNKSALNLFARGTYTLQGTLTLPTYIDNTAQVRARILVQVLPKPAPRDVTITNDTFVGSTTAFFISVGDFVVNDPVDKVHVVSFLGDGYDNTYFQIKDNILFWSSAERAPGKTSFSIVVRVTDRDGNTLDKFFEIKRTRPDFSSVTIFNTFTPNGDRFNDTWGVPEVRFYEGVRISVYERGGTRLFYTENPDIRWDGTYNGKDMPVGSYYWVIEIGETGETRRGVLNLIRE
jgi:gliding motility-associated-like protein